MLATRTRSGSGSLADAHAPAPPGTLEVVAGGTWLLTDGVISLLPLRAEHIPAVATSAADAHARRMLAHAVDLAGTAEDRQRAVGEYLLGPWAYFREPFAVAVEGSRRGSLRVVGVRWLTRTSRSGLFSCGGWIAARERRRGYGSRALRLACAYAEAVHGAPAIMTGTRVDNLAAQANLAACGFRRATGDDAELVRVFSPQPAFIESWVRFADPSPAPLALGGRHRPPSA